MNRLRKSASPASTWFGGIVGVPSALRVSDSTTITLVNAVHSTSRAGAIDSTVSSRMMLTVWLGLPTPGSRSTETLPGLLTAPEVPGAGLGGGARARCAVSGWARRAQRVQRVPRPLAAWPPERRTRPTPAPPGRPVRRRPGGRTAGRAAGRVRRGAGGQPRRVVHSRSASTNEPAVGGPAGRPPGPAGPARRSSVPVGRARAVLRDVLRQLLRLLLQLAQDGHRGLGHADEQQPAAGADDGQARPRLRP